MFTLPDDPYARLGVSQDAQIPEIRQAHRKLILRCHPDKVSDPEQKAIKQEEFQKVQRAYEMLSDSKERQKYDDMARANEMEKQNARLRAEQAARSPPRRETNAETHHYNVRMAGEPRFERSASSYAASPKSHPAYASARTPPSRSYEENIYSSSYEDGREHRSSRKAGASSYEREVPSSRRSEEDKRSRKEADKAWDRQREKAEKDASRRKAEEKERDRREKEKDKDRRKKKDEVQQKDRKRDTEEKRTRHRSPYHEDPEPVSPIIMEARHKEEKSKAKANTRAKVVEPAPIREAIAEDRHRVKQDAHLEFAAQYLQSSRNKVVPGLARSKTYHPSMDTRYAPPVPTPPPAAGAMAPPPPPPIPEDDEPIKRSSARRSSETPRSKLSSSHRKSSKHEEEPRVIPGFKKYSSMPSQRHSPPEVPESPPRIHRSQTQTDAYSRPMPGPHPGISRAQTWYPATTAEDDYRESSRSRHHHGRYHSDEDYDDYSEEERYNSRRPTRHHSPEAPKTQFRYTVEGNKTIPVRPRAESPRRGYKASPYYSHEPNTGRPMASYESSYEQPAAYFPKVKYAPKYDADDVAYSTTSEAGYRMTEPPQVYGF